MTAPILTELKQPLSQSLPFSLDETSFSLWLEMMVKKDKLELLQILTEVLEQLKNTELQADTRATFLTKIAVLVFKVTDDLQKTYVDSYFPFSEQDSLKIQLSISSIFEMAENYALVCKDPSFKLTAIFSQAEKALILLNSIKAMSSILLYKAIVYEGTRKGFWGLCFLFYLFARQNDVLELIPNQWQESFVNVFKQLLVFELSNTQQFNTEEIHTVFQLLKNMSDKIKLLSIVPEKMMSKVPCINLRMDNPPAVSKDTCSEESPYIFYISNLNLIKQLFDLSAHKKNISYRDKVLVLRLIKTLAMNQHRKDKRKLADNELLAEVGIDKFIEHLIAKENLSQIKGGISYDAKGLSLDENQKQTDKDEYFEYRSELGASLSLATSTDDAVVEYVDNTDIWGGKNTKKPESLVESDTNATLIDQSRLGFCLKLKEKGVVTKVGDLIHLFMYSVSVVTVVRRIVKADDAGVVVVVGVEVLGYDAELLHIMDIEDQGAAMACILVNIEGEESIVIKANEFHNEQHLYIDKNEKILRYQVEKILDTSTAIIKHLKVSLS